MKTKTLAVAAIALATVAAQAKHLKVLMIGNSFSVCVLQQMPQCAEAAGETLDLAALTIGGCPLEKHWNNVLKADNPEFKPYSFSWSYAGKKGDKAAPVAKLGHKTNLPQALVADKWDIVTIQQASPKSQFFETYEPFAGNLIAKIRELAPQAEIVIQQTWSYSPYNGLMAGQWKCTPAEMHANIKNAYAQLAAKYGLRQIHTGDAVQMYRNLLPVGYKPGYIPPEEVYKLTKKLEKPNLVDFKGDVVGNSHWGKGRKGTKDADEIKLRIDSIHLNPQGHYLQALVWMAELFGTDVTKLDYRPDCVSEEKAALMRKVAMAAARGGIMQGDPGAKLLACGSTRIVCINPDGSEAWVQKDCGNVHRAYFLDDGSLVYSNQALMLVDKPGAKDAKTTCIYSGETKDNIYGIELLPDGRLVAAENATDKVSCFKPAKDGNQKKIFEFKADISLGGKIPEDAHQHFRMCRLTSKDTVLACCSGSKVVREYDKSGKIVWEQAAPGPLAFDCLRRKNGNTLVSHLDAISEFTPDHKLVWQFKCEDAPELQLSNLCGIQELENGNLVVGTYCNGRPDASRATAFEITRDKKVVWAWYPTGDKTMMTCWKLAAAK